MRQNCARIAPELRLELRRIARGARHPKLLAVDDLAHLHALRGDAARRVGPPLDRRVEVRRVAAVGQDAEDELQRAAVLRVVRRHLRQELLDAARRVALDHLARLHEGEAALLREAEEPLDEELEDLQRGRSGR